MSEDTPSPRPPAPARQGPAARTMMDAPPRSMARALDHLGLGYDPVEGAPDQDSGEVVPPPGRSED